MRDEFFNGPKRRRRTESITESVDEGEATALEWMTARRGRKTSGKSPNYWHPSVRTCVRAALVKVDHEMGKLGLGFSPRRKSREGEMGEGPSREIRAV